MLATPSVVHPGMLPLLSLTPPCVRILKFPRYAISCRSPLKDRVISYPAIVGLLIADQIRSALHGDIHHLQVSGGAM